MVMTVSRALKAIDALNSRKSELVELRNKNSVRTSYLGDPNKVVEPLYDAAKVDGMISDISQAILDLRAEIDSANARTSIEVDFQVKSLLKPIDA